MPTEDEVKLVRDAFLESYVRRMPPARPDETTSVYCVLEACAAVIANLLTPESTQKLLDFLEADRRAPISPPPDPAAYEPLTVDGDPNPDREPDEWPCFSVQPESIT